ncbi:MAG: hypothetical protein CVT66_10270 [Actinobacteria bacterium HGW-Actinobacteria-6]|jgi:hypothetical protein|nr:MAG: hypothetical protein CVT66_10270 [Actinobacteria bacterium HGW-Actinobacteria-6]
MSDSEARVLIIGALGCVALVCDFVAWMYHISGIRTLAEEDWILSLEKASRQMILIAEVVFAFLFLGGFIVAMASEVDPGPGAKVILAVVFVLGWVFATFVIRHYIMRASWGLPDRWRGGHKW